MQTAQKKNKDICKYNLEFQKQIHLTLFQNIAFVYKVTKMKFIQNNMSDFNSSEPENFHFEMDTSKNQHLA